MIGFKLQGTIGSAFLISLLLSPNIAVASGLQVSPISLRLQAKENASGLTLSNTGDEQIHAQVRVYQWTQNQTGDQLNPSRGLLASPPMISLDSGDKQLVRIIRATAPPQGEKAVEDTYRIVVDEIPTQSTEAKSGLQFNLSYSLPVFVQPAGVAKTQPQLQWHYHLLPDNKQIKLSVSNSGNGHAKLSGLSFIDTTGNRTDIRSGLLGYVLPGATMHWTLKIPPSVLVAGGKFKVMINGNEATPNITLDNTIR